MGFTGLIILTFTMISCSKEEIIQNSNQHLYKKKDAQNDGIYSTQKPAWLAALGIKIEIKFGENQVVYDACGTPSIAKCIGSGFCSISVNGAFNNPIVSDQSIGKIYINENNQIVSIWFDVNSMDNSTVQKHFGNLQFSLTKDYQFDTDFTSTNNLKAGLNIPLGNYTCTTENNFIVINF